MEPIGDELVSELVIKATDTVRLTFEKVTPPTKHKSSSHLLDYS